MIAERLGDTGVGLYAASMARKTAMRRTGQVVVRWVPLVVK